MGDCTVVISEPQFRFRLYGYMDGLRAIYKSGKKRWFKSVTGPGRSGAIAGVYASHYLGLPYIPISEVARGLPESLYPVMILDTAAWSGATLRKAGRKVERTGGFGCGYAIYKQPPRVKFWYEK